jgi:hypothetical protein
MIPALLTRTAGAPVVGHPPDGILDLVGLRDVHLDPQRGAPAARIASTVLPVAACARSRTATANPSRASLRATAAPMPRAAPVTTATRGAVVSVGVGMVVTACLLEGFGR